MLAFFLIFPMFLIRYGLLYLVNPVALQKAAHFPSMVGQEKSAYLIYQVSQILILIWICISKIKTGTIFFYVGLPIYLLGILLQVLSTIDFAKPAPSGVNQSGIYRFSRNPMYIGYFVYFLGCVLLTQSPLLLIILISFQVSAHWIIKAEERWCIETYGQKYIQYMKKVRRYI